MSSSVFHSIKLHWHLSFWLVKNIIEVCFDFFLNLGDTTIKLTNLSHYFLVMQFIVTVVAFNSNTCLANTT